MNKREFLKELKGALSALPAKDKKERLSFYSEIIDDKIEEGTPESVAVSEVGSVSEIAAKIIAENKNSPSAKAHTRRTLTAGERVVMIIGAPIWLPLAIAAFAVILSLYAVAYCLLLVLWAIELPFLLMALLSKALLPACTLSTKALLSFTKASFKKLFAPLWRKT